ncbi:MAG: hypothetical protein J6V95_08555 [Bacteroidaceae bacterium]|nr:hypothetical protein [Bacteroidaceae bacterium]
MNKRTLLTLSLLLVGMGISSIRAQKATDASLTDFEATSLSTQPRMFGVPLVADVKIIPDAKHTFTMDAEVNLPERGSKESDNSYLKRVNSYVKERLEEIKTEAIFNFSDEADADVIVSPNFSITTASSNGLNLKMKVKVRGYPAKYDNFRNLTDQDEKLVELSSRIGSTNNNVIAIGSTELAQEIVEADKKK